MFADIYQIFKEKLLSATQKLSIGIDDSDFLGPVINNRSLENLIGCIEDAKHEGARILCGGKRYLSGGCKEGFYFEPTIVEEATPDAKISKKELFGPVTNLYKVKSFQEALDLTNDSVFGLTASIHTASLHRAMTFSQKVKTGVVVVNGGTHGSEPHMGFGGLKNSGTGWKEAGTEALDVYSDWKYINLITDPSEV